jgi:hypothetical protein
MIPGPIEQNTYGKGGIYECLHIQKKSLTYKEYKKKTISFDKITEGKSSEEVEDLVTLSNYCSFGKILHSALLFTEPISNCL